MTAAENQVEGTAPAGETAAQAETRKRAAASNFLPIVRGRLPLLFVHAIRFDKTLAAMSNKDVASKFATSVGKVFDIRKGRNFGYVGEGFKPSAEDVTAAKAWIEATGGTNAKGLVTAGDKSLMQTTLDGYEKAGLATAEEVAAFTAARGATRKPATPATGATAPTLPAGTTQASAEGAGAALLS